MKNILINLLFKLLGNTSEQQYSIGYLFGASTTGHDARRKRWKRALKVMYQNKDFLDFLYYLAESDKENIFKGKIDPMIAKGARIRTLYIVKEAHRAYEEMTVGKKIDANSKDEIQSRMKKVESVYKKLTDVDK